MMSSEINTTGGSDNVVVCTSALSQAVVHQAMEARRRHITVSIVVAVPQAHMRSFYKDNRAVLAQLENAGANCVTLSVDSDGDSERDGG